MQPFYYPAFHPLTRKSRAPPKQPFLRDNPIGYSTPAAETGSIRKRAPSARGMPRGERRRPFRNFPSSLAFVKIRPGL